LSQQKNSEVISTGTFVIFTSKPVDKVFKYDQQREQNFRDLAVETIYILLILLYYRMSQYSTLKSVWAVNTFQWT